LWQWSKGFDLSVVCSSKQLKVIIKEEEATEGQVGIIIPFEKLESLPLSHLPDLKASTTGMLYHFHD
jgi:hypothetical protein